MIRPFVGLMLNAARGMADGPESAKKPPVSALYSGPFRRAAKM
jgi:hypothetical protein